MIPSSREFSRNLANRLWACLFGRGIVHPERFFYPLDTLLDWNRAYGKQGFLQYQFVVPDTDNHRAIKQILSEIRRAGME